MKIPFLNRAKGKLNRTKTETIAVTADQARIKREEDYMKMLDAKTRTRKRRSYGQNQK